MLHVLVPWSTSCGLKMRISDGGRAHPKVLGRPRLTSPHCHRTNTSFAQEVTRLSSLSVCGGRWVIKVSTVSAAGSVEGLMKWLNGSIVGNLIAGALLRRGYKIPRISHLCLHLVTELRCALVMVCHLEDTAPTQSRRRKFRTYPIPSRTRDPVSADIQALSTELEDFEREDELRGARGVRGGASSCAWSRPPWPQ